MNLVEQLPPNLSGLEQLHKLMQSGGRPPIGDTLDFTLVEASEGFAAFESVPSLRAYNLSVRSMADMQPHCSTPHAAAPPIPGYRQRRPIQRWNSRFRTIKR